uniref:Uncharacterized protein n=1 Tax=Piliocolobus tephrosceles TaxID=591936 RepID=A0A8C9GK54_9PRIM
NPGGSRCSDKAVMAQKEGDVRDYNLTEEQKAIKANYPPVNRNYNLYLSIITLNVNILKSPIKRNKVAECI